MIFGNDEYTKQRRIEMASPMTGYTRCPKCGLVVYVWQDSGTCYVCGKIKIERKGKSEDNNKQNHK